MNSTAAMDMPLSRHSTTSALWGHLLRKSGSQLPSQATTGPPSAKPIPSIAPIDKAGASTRILLHDTQARLENFTDRVAQLVTGLDDAKRELSGVQTLYQDEHEQLVERMIALVNRCQTELQKALGSPAQSAKVHELSMNLSALGSRMEALDKKLDMLNSLNQTHCQVLQTIQDQQGQILAAVLPLLPLVQSVPLHVENARNQVKDSVSELSQDVSSLAHAILSSNSQQTSKRERSRASDSMDHLTSLGSKRRRVDDNGPTSSTSPESMDRLSARPAVPTVVPAVMPTADTPSTAVLSRPSRKTVLRSPLVDLPPSDQRTVTPTTRAANPTTPVVIAAQSLTSVSRPLGSSHNSLASSVATPAPRHALSTHPRPSLSHAATPLVPAGGQKLPVITHYVCTTPQNRSGTLRQLDQADRLPPIPMTPVLDFRRSGALWASLGGGHRMDMRSPSGPPSSAGKPMKLKDRRALIPDDLTVSYHPCFRV
ncbi:hypothetical protein C8Q80DRAFT_1195826 [Daedaleopsis nitida]|nr:hypothetical protein C8Q80DRAFT_1195826 [Daedaleopsis nitida]